jgi:hypothetical protein
VKISALKFEAVTDSGCPILWGRAFQPEGWETTEDRSEVGPVSGYG